MSNLSDRQHNGDLAVTCYWENNATKAGTGFSQPTPPPPSRAPGTPRQCSEAAEFGCWGAALGFHRLGTLSLNTFPHGGDALRLRQPGHRGDAHLFRKYRAFSIALKRSKSEKCKRKIKKNLHFSSTYWKMKDLFLST